MDKKLLSVLVCPHCKQPLEYQSSQQRLVCRQEQLWYPVRDQIPILLASDAQPLAGPA